MWAYGKVYTQLNKFTSHGLTILRKTYICNKQMYQDLKSFVLRVKSSKTGKINVKITFHCNRLFSHHTNKSITVLLLKTQKTVCDSRIKRRRSILTVLLRVTETEITSLYWVRSVRYTSLSDSGKTWSEPPFLTTSVILNVWREIRDPW